MSDPKPSNHHLFIPKSEWNSGVNVSEYSKNKTKVRRNIEEYLENRKLESDVSIELNY